MTDQSDDDGFPEPGDSTTTINFLRDDGLLDGYRTDAGAVFSSEATAHLRRGPSRWAVRGHGSKLGDILEPKQLMRVIDRVAKSTQWNAASLYPGAGQPGIAAAFGGASVVLLMAPGIGEEAVDGPDGPIYPTVVGGEMLARLAASSPEERLDEELAHLGRRATNVYAQTLREIVKNDFALEFAVRPLADPKPVLVPLTISQAQEDLARIERAPTMKTETIERNGLLVDLMGRPDGDKFVLEEDDGSRIRGVIHPDIRDRVAWRSRVTATLRVEAPVEEWLPRAPRPTYTLMAVRPGPPREAA